MKPKKIMVSIDDSKILESRTSKIDKKSDIGFAAAKRNALMDKISSKEWILNLHIAYLLAFPDSTYINKWKREIKDFLLSFQKKIKPDNDYLDQETYLELLFEERFENGKETYEDSLLRKIIAEALSEKSKLDSVYRNTKKKIPLDKIKANMKSFYYYVSDLLSQGQLTQKNVYALLDKYILEKK